MDVIFLYISILVNVWHTEAYFFDLLNDGDTINCENSYLALILIKVMVLIMVISYQFWKSRCSSIHFDLACLLMPFLSLMSSKIIYTIGEEDFSIKLWELLPIVIFSGIYIYFYVGYSICHEQLLFWLLLCSGRWVNPKTHWKIKKWGSLSFIIIKQTSSFNYFGYYFAKWFYFMDLIIFCCVFYCIGFKIYFYFILVVDLHKYILIDFNWQ